MESIEHNEIELFGEDGARLIVSVNDGSWHPERAGIELRLYQDGHHSGVYLDIEEANQLRAMIAAQIPRRKFGDKAVVFEGKPGHSIAFRPGNMGEPFREGLEIYHLAGEDGRGTLVFLQNNEALKLGAAIGVIFQPSAASGLQP